MEALDLIAKVWPLVIGLLGLIVWLVRLEGKVRYLEDDHKTLSIKHATLDSSLVKELSQVKVALGRIEGILSIKYLEHKGD